VASEMDFTDPVHGKVLKILGCRAGMIGARHMNVVDVEQQSAPRTAGDFLQEVEFAHRALFESNVGRRILQEHLASDLLLDLVDVIAHAVEGRLVVRHGKKVVEIGGVMRGPGEVLGKEARLISPVEVSKSLKVSLVERLFAADGKADAVERQRVPLPDCFKLAMRHSARTHVVFGMNFEKADIRTCIQDILNVVRLQPRAGTRRYGSVNSCRFG